MRTVLTLGPQVISGGSKVVCGSSTVGALPTLRDSSTALSLMEEDQANLIKRILHAKRTYSFPAVEDIQKVTVSSHSKLPYLIKLLSITYYNRWIIQIGSNWRIKKTNCKLAFLDKKAPEKITWGAQTEKIKISNFLWSN